MSEIKIVKKNVGSDNMALERYLREKQNIEERKNIEILLELLRSNPDMTEDMIRVDLREYFGKAKREYIKENCVNSTKKR